VHSGSLDAGHYYSFFTRDGKWYLADDMTHNIKPVTKTSNYDMSGSYIVFYTPGAPVPQVETNVETTAVVEEIAESTPPSAEVKAEAVEEKKVSSESEQPAVQQQQKLDTEGKETEQLKAQTVVPPKTEAPVPPVVVSTIPTTSSVVEKKTSESSETGNMSSSVPLGNSTPILKRITVRKLNAKRGGAEVVNPEALQELLSVGGTKLGITAVKVRRLDTEAEIGDLNTIQHLEVVYLTTEQDEKDF